jgi:segregation and condensation protein B
VTDQEPTTPPPTPEQHTDTPTPSTTEPTGDPVAEPPANSSTEAADPEVEAGQEPTDPADDPVDEPPVHSATQPSEAEVPAAPEAGTDDEGLEGGLAPLGDADLESALEALLLVVDSPAEEESLATALATTPLRVAEHLRLMSDRYTDQDRGIDLRRAGGGWRFYTRDRYAPYVEKLLLDGQRAKLTRAALETLAVIAYRQPVTRARVAAVRGVNCDGVIRTLLARGLVEETGTDLETGGFLYRTTELFLERLGLSSLDDLPPIAPLLPEVDSIDEL